MFPAAEIAGDEGILPYGSCLRLDTAGEILGPIFKIDFGVDETSPGLRDDAHHDLRAAHRRLRDRHDAGRAHRDARDVHAHEVAGRRGSHDRRRLLAGPRRLHAASRGLDDRRLRAERHVLGPARGRVRRRAAARADAARDDAEREDGTTDGTTRVAVPTVDRRSRRSTIRRRWRARCRRRCRRRPGRAPARRRRRSPTAQIPRVCGIATFVWIGDDPQVKTPHVTLQYETSPGVVRGRHAQERSRRRGSGDRDRVHAVAAATHAGRRRTSGSSSGRRCRGSARPTATRSTRAASVRLGNYRFHVDGKGWTLD